MIGGGAGSGYPKQAVEKLITSRKKKLESEEAEKWKGFAELRRPEQMRQWAKVAGLANCEIAGKGGAISTVDRSWAGSMALVHKAMNH